MTTAAECIARASVAIRDNTNEQQREALASVLDPEHGYAYSFSTQGMHVEQRGRKYTITPFGTVHHHGFR